MTESDRARTPGEHTGVFHVVPRTPRTGEDGRGRRMVVCCGSGPTPLVGSERFALHLASGLASAGDEVDLILQTPGPVDPADLASAVVTPLPAFDVESVSTRVARPDVVLVVDLVWAASARLGRDLARAWGVPWAVVPASAQDAWLDHAESIALCTQADGVLTVTAAEGRALHRSGVRNTQPHVIGFGCYLEPAADLPVVPGVGDRDVVLFLGRKRRDKGYRTLLDAAPLVWSHRPGVSFVFAGPRIDADWRDAFAAIDDPRIIELDAVPVDMKDALIERCTVLCLPTTSDIFPQVFVEAWRAGKPVVSGPFDGAHEVVRHGVDGIVAEDRPGAVAEALISLFDHPDRAATMGRAGQARVHETLNWPAAIGRVRDAIAAVLERSPEA